MEVAQGEYVTFVDADDTVRADCLEKFVKCFERYHADLVMAGAVRIDSSGGGRESHWKGESVYLEKEEIIQFFEDERATAYSVWGKAFRNDHIKKILACFKLGFVWLTNLELLCARKC